MRHWHLLVSTLLATALATPALAEEAREHSDAPKPAAAPAKAPAAAAKTFSTGVAKGRDLLDSAISASVIDETDLAKLSVSSIGGIMQNIPGIRAETSDIDGFSAITVRGLPLAADGSKFLQIQEDGLPVLEFGDVFAASADQFIRADLTLSQLQAIRGGSASTFASNSPGGVVNLISKTGETAGGAIQLSSGVDYDLKRLDFAYGSPLGDGWRFHFGGFFRQGEGPRVSGYDGFRGGQIKANITKQFAGGYIRLYAKYLDDRVPNYTGHPILIGGTNDKPTFTDVPGANVRGEAYDTLYTVNYIGVDQRNNPTTFDASNGLHGVSKSIGLEAQFDVAGWTVTNRFRFAGISGEFNDNITLITAPAPMFAGLLGGPGATLSYAGGPLGGQTIVDGRLVGLSVRNNTKLNQIDNLTNDLRATRVWNLGEGKFTATAGLYKSAQSIDKYTNMINTLNDISGGGRNAPINLTTATGVSLTDNGIYAYGFGVSLPISTYHVAYDLQYNILAPYGSFNYQRGKLAIGGSLRWDRGKARGNVTSDNFSRGRPTSAPIDVNGDGVISVPESRVAILTLGSSAAVNYDYHYLSYSAGVNYRFAEPFSAFARYSRGARANAERTLQGRNLNQDTGKLFNPEAAFSSVKQAEMGVKFRKGGLTAFVTGFWASTGEKNFQIGANAAGQVVVFQIDRTYSAKGIEFEGEARHGPLSLTLGATWTNAKIDKDATDPTLNGKHPRHIPSFAFQARPQLELSKFTLGTVINGTTSSFAQDTNVLKQPGYVIVSPFLQIRPADRVQISVNAFNVFNKLAIVQLSSAAIPPSGVTNAQVMNGRTLTASVRYTF